MAMSGPEPVAHAQLARSELTDSQLASLARVLRWGVLLASVLLVLGVGISIAQVVPFDPTLNLPWANHRWFRWPFLAGHLSSGSGVAVATVGLLVLVATPGARVLLGAYHFARNRDRTLTIIAAVVFLLLLVGAFLLGPLLG